MAFLVRDRTPYHPPHPPARSLDRSDLRIPCVRSWLNGIRASHVPVIAPTGWPPVGMKRRSSYPLALALMTIFGRLGKFLTRNLKKITTTREDENRTDRIS